MTQDLLARRHSIAIYGTGGFGREVAWLMESIPDYHVSLFVDDEPDCDDLNGIPVVSLDEVPTTTGVFVAVGDPKVRQRLVDRCHAHGTPPFRGAVHGSVQMGPRITYGAGTLICAGCILTCDIRIGDQVHVNLGCTIGHDVVIGDFATVAPGVHVSGCVHIGTRAYLGTGAVVVNGTQETPILIGDDAVIGAGAVVTKDIPPGVTAVGVPARWS